MSARHIIDEFGRLPLVSVKDWHAVGIPKSVQIVVRAGGIRQTRARFAFDPTLGRYWEFDSTGLPAWAVGAYEDQRLIDIIAWPLDRPRQHARLYRTAWALGADEAMDPNRIGDNPEKYPPVYVPW